jgi:hypothetical protein
LKQLEWHFPQILRKPFKERLGHIEPLFTSVGTVSADYLKDTVLAIMQEIKEN